MVPRTWHQSQHLLQLGQPPYRMLQGKAPIGTDNLRVSLHHNVGIANDINDFREILTSVHRADYKALHSYLFK